MQSRMVSGPSGGGASVSEISSTATLHGRELLDGGYTIDQVVHDYGDLCQAITDLAFERNWPIQVDEFRTLNRCLDNGIADAVTEFNGAARRRGGGAERSEPKRTARFVRTRPARPHPDGDVRGGCNQDWAVPLSGATGAILDRSLDGLRHRIDRSLAETRVAAGLPIPKETALPDRLRREGQRVRVARSAGAGMHIDRSRGRAGARSRGRSRHAIVGNGKPAAKRDQVHEAGHRGVIERPFSR